MEWKVYVLMVQGKLMSTWRVKEGDTDDAVEAKAIKAMKGASVAGYAAEIYSGTLTLGDVPVNMIGGVDADKTVDS
jgi:hypothetical protein